jgi:hypothetical protein
MSRYPGGIIRKTPVTPAGPFQNGTAPGVWTLADAAYWTKQGLWPIAGNAQPAIEDYFSTYLYTGNGSTQTITNGIDLSGQGGMVWIKARNSAQSNIVFDTNRGVENRLVTNADIAQSTLSGSLTAFNSNGFALGNFASTNNSGTTYASWTFREAPKFFDVVTYTGNGVSGRQIAHNLGSTPGCIMIKATSVGGTPSGWISPADWWVYHRGLPSPSNFSLRLNTTAAQNNSGGLVATSTTFTVYGATPDSVLADNVSGVQYVAYLYAHDTASDGLIQCGGYTGNGSTAGPTVNLGWEAQWVLIKSASSGAGPNSWVLFDNMRGMAVTSSNMFLSPNLSAAEQGPVDWVQANATGFQIRNVTGSMLNQSGEAYVYIAIRRGPMKTPTLGTSVFNAQAGLTTDANKITTGFVTDWFWERGNYTGTGDFQCSQRLTQTALTFTSTAAEGGPYSAGYLMFDYNDGFLSNLSGNINPGLMYGFRRAPGFFDVVCLNSTTSAAQVIQHNLGVAPQIIISKRRNGTSSWQTMDATNYLRLNTDQADLGVPTYHTFTSTSFSIDAGACSSGENWVFYLFASAPGVSKVGTYTGNGSSQTINCAFTTGARFVLIKRTDSTGDWYVWDSARGIVAGNDPYLALNTTAAQVTSNDSVDTDNTGFIVNQVAASNVNVNAATYIFLAIA